MAGKNPAGEDMAGRRAAKGWASGFIKHYEEILGIPTGKLEQVTFPK